MRAIASVIFLAWLAAPATAMAAGRHKAHPAAHGSTARASKKTPAAKHPWAGHKATPVKHKVSTARTRTAHSPTKPAVTSKPASVKAKRQRV